MIRPLMRGLLWLIFVVFSLALLARTFAGAITGPPVSIHSPLNVASFVAVSFMLLLVARPGTAARDRSGTFECVGRTRTTFAVVSFLAILCFAAFQHALDAPFVFDDYGHVMLAAHARFQDFVAAFYRPHRDIFFRPLGFLSFATDIRWAGFDPFRWHAWSVAVHFVNCLLVYVLANQLGFGAILSTASASLFAIHGSRAEAVGWIDARFDLLAGFFVLAGLICIERHARRGGYKALGCGLALATLALFAKEAAFCVPFVVLALSLFHYGEARRRMLRIVPVLCLLCAAQFAYRLWIIGGVGGYQTGGHADVLTFSLIRSAKALLWRLWALLFFPINWSAEIGSWSKIALLVFTGVLFVIACKARVDRKRLAAALLVTIAASLPVQHLLLLEADLAGARILYLPVLGTALMWAVIAEGAGQSRSLRYTAAAAVLFFNLCCLERNIGIWSSVARQAKAVCQQFGAAIADGSGTVEVANLPVKRQGVFFLSDAFADCVEMNAGVPAKRIVPVGQGERKFRWDEELQRIEPADAGKPIR
jgi:hypothetical protein